MQVILILLSALVLTGTVLYIHHRLVGNGDSEIGEQETADDSSETDNCCGMHITCEKDSLSPVFAEEIVYFDDEELDIYARRHADDYSDKEIEQFREVLLTLRPEEIAEWARSIQLRQIELPTIVKDELFIIVEEARSNLITSR